MSLKQKIIGILIALGLILIGVFAVELYSKTALTPMDQSQSFDSTQGKPVQQNNSGVKVVGGNINLDQITIISPTSDLEVTFNKPMVQDNTRVSVDPKIGYRTELSSDHHTLKIIPDKSLELGKEYTLTIKSGYATDTQEHLDADLNFHFKTISYSGV